MYANPVLQCVNFQWCADRRALPVVNIALYNNYTERLRRGMLIITYVHARMMMFIATQHIIQIKVLLTLRAWRSDFDLVILISL